MLEWIPQNIGELEGSGEGESKMKHKVITVVHLMDLLSYPPVFSLIQVLLHHGNKVNLVSFGVSMAPAEILENPDFQYMDLGDGNPSGYMAKITREDKRRRLARIYTQKYMEHSDILWTTTDFSVRSLGAMCLKYKHVMQLMELEEYCPIIHGFGKFPLDKYSRKAWKNVVPEINRAYIQKTWWSLNSVPYVLPNKPYRMLLGAGCETARAIEEMRKTGKKIILYLGVISSDRNLDTFAEAISRLKHEYCFCIAGRIHESMQIPFKNMLQSFPNVLYLGYFKAPTHLSLLTEAYIGMLPYEQVKRHPFISPLNALYCAPNKIFEYAGCDVPMIGTNVMGLKVPFEQYNIGVCCEDNSPEKIIEAIKKVETNYDKMKTNCKTFYDSVDLDAIVEKILSDD